jgi:hypothetical protein
MKGQCQGIEFWSEQARSHDPMLIVPETGLLDEMDGRGFSCQVLICSGLGNHCETIYAWSRLRKLPAEEFSRVHLAKTPWRTVDFWKDNN